VQEFKLLAGDTTGNLSPLSPQQALAVEKWQKGNHVLGIRESKGCLFYVDPQNNKSLQLCAVQRVPGPPPTPAPNTTAAIGNTQAAGWQPSPISRLLSPKLEGNALIVRTPKRPGFNKASSSPKRLKLAADAVPHARDITSSAPMGPRGGPSSRPPPLV